MRFASCRAGDRTFAARVEDGHVLPLAGIAELGPATDFETLRDAPTEDEAFALDDVELRAVVPHPRRVLCLGLNYRAHVDETGRDLPEYPVLFAKFASSLIGPYEPIAVPPESRQVDYEAEMVIVIGRRVRRVPRDRAAAAVGGFAVGNDVTMRDYQYKTHQWIQGKAWDRSTPVGPYLVTPDEVGDPGRLDIRLELNGQEMQGSSTSRLIFDVPTIVSTISEFTTLEPGDLIFTGTPGGVGFRRDPQIFLTPGDRVRVEISGIGAIENEVVEEVM